MTRPQLIVLIGFILVIPALIQIAKDPRDNAKWILFALLDGITTTMLVINN